MNKLDFIDNKDLARRVEFIVEADKMKTVLRRTLIVDGSRRENDAEHSWHLALMAMIFEQYSVQKVDMLRVIRMAVVHDLIEVYAGDTFAYDAQGNEDKLERETAAADKLYSILPSPQGGELRALWEEFDALETAESRYANAMDRLQPLIHNYLTDGHTWKLGNVHAPQVLERMEPIRETVPEAWKIVVGIVESSIAKGILQP